MQEVTGKKLYYKYVLESVKDRKGFTVSLQYLVRLPYIKYDPSFMSLQHSYLFSFMGMWDLKQLYWKKALSHIPIHNRFACSEENTSACKAAK